MKILPLCFLLFCFVVSVSSMLTCVNYINAYCSPLRFSRSMQQLFTEERTGRRQRPGSDEFEPLNSRQDAPGAGHRGGMAGRICQSLRCCWTAEALFFLLGVLMLVYLYSINMYVLKLLQFLPPGVRFNRCNRCAAVSVHLL